MCRDRGWEVVEVFEDNDISAYSGKPRPGYQALLAAVESRRIDAVVVWHNDRLHRSPRELESFIDLVNRTGAAVSVVCGGDYDLASPDGRLAARIVGAVARKESEDKSRRAKRKHLELAEQGRPAGRLPWGVGSDAERLLVAEAAEGVLAGRTLRSLVRDLNDHGVPGPTGGPWSTVGFRRVLLAPAIAGLREYGGLAYEGTWEGALSRDVWEEVRVVLNNPARRTNGGIGRKYLLTGLIFCGVCGKRVHARPRSDKSRSYACVSGENFWGCGKTRRLAEPVEELVRSTVLAYLVVPSFRDDLRDFLGVGDGDDGKDTAALARTDERLVRLEDALVEGDVTKESYRARRVALQRDRDVLAQRVVQRQQAHISFTPDPVAAWDTGDLSVRRSLLKLVVSKVVIRPARRGYNRFDPTKVEVHMPVLAALRAGRERWLTMTDDEKADAEATYNDLTAAERAEDDLTAP